MRYVYARLQKDSLDTAYRIYVSDSLKLISENTAKYAGGGSLTGRYADLLKPKKVETRTADEVIEGIRNKLKSLEG